MPTKRSSNSSAGHPTLAMRWIGAGILCLTFFSSFVGCSGCSQEDPVAKAQREKEEKEKADEEKRRKEKEKPKPDFEMAAVEVFPTPIFKILSDNPDDKSKQTQIEPLLKSGHWGTGLSYWRANNFDFSGRLRATYSDGKNPFDIERTNFRLSTSRPAIFTKGTQLKALETTFFVPRRSEKAGSTGIFKLELLTGRSGGVRDERGFLSKSIHAHEYFFVVLTSSDGKYEFLRKNDDTFPSMCMRDEKDLDGSLRMYHVQTPSIKNRIPLSEYSLAWTSIAYILMDDVDPALFSVGQQTAMLDWLHWGGQILVSGPQSLDRLKGSFLEPYLPATAGASSKIDAAALQPINDFWSLRATIKTTADQPNILVVPDKPIVGVTLVKSPEADFVPNTGDLVAERRIGQGRIVVTSFPLADFRIQNWRNYDGFFNGCLLRRPPRKFIMPDLSALPSSSNGTVGLGTTFKWQVSAKVNGDKKTLEHDPEEPRISTALRYFSRDSGQIDGKPQPLPPAPLLGSNNPLAQNLETTERGRLWWEYDFSPEATAFPEWHFAGSEGTRSSGIAGWNDFSGAANAARDTLREAAGIRIPTGMFVMQVLGVYLLVLVPLNWLVFWLLGRVEWAWACAPIIAIFGAFGVIRLAQLDIGFAYSRTEVAILETHGSYPRGHLTRFTTLYTSLSSSYTIDFDDPSAQALPFSTDPLFERALGRTAQACQFDREKSVALSNIQIPSNSTGTVRSEHMADLGSGLILAGDDATGFSVKNGSALALKDIGIIRCQKESGNLQVAYIKSLAPGVSNEIEFDSSDKQLLIDGWQQSPIMSPDLPDNIDPGVIRLGRLVQVASKQMQILPGDVRLIAWTDDEIPGMTIYPSAPQNQVRTLVVAHLAHGQLPPPEKDVNVYRDIRPEREIFDGSDFSTTPTSLKTE